MDFLQIGLYCFAFFAIIYAYFYFCYKYWEKRNFPFLPPRFPLGNSSQFLKFTRNFNLESMKYHDDIKERGFKFAGIYTILRPVLVVIDPEIIKDILTRDFSYFADRGFYNNKKEDPYSVNLFTADHAEWRPLRTHLTPTFTSGKMKMMFSSILQLSESMINNITKSVEQHDDIEIRECLARFTTDSIGLCAFGIEPNNFKSSESELRDMGKRMFQIRDGWHILENLLIANMPDLARKLGLRIIRKDVSDQLRSIFERNKKFREENNVDRPDFFQLVLGLLKDGFLTENQVIGQMFIFFLAGFDTSTSTMNFTLYELARHPEIQEKVRQEIQEVLANYGGKITYEGIREMKYLQQVIDESQRLYPPVPNLQRVCVKDYTLRDTNLVVEKRTHILIPIISLQRDPDYYPDPLKFDPERFSPENKNSSRHPYVHLPFGEGPRNCIGVRFGLMQSKIGIINILSHFRLQISPKMNNKPLTLDKSAFLLVSKEVLYLTAEKL